MAQNVMTLWLGECLVDYLKHIFLVRLNKLNNHFYRYLAKYLCKTYVAVSDLNKSESPVILRKRRSLDKDTEVMQECRQILDKIHHD
jgi:predicted P-loop ATPase/GTPase